MNKESTLANGPTVVGRLKQGRPGQPPDIAAKTPTRAYFI